MKLNKKFEKQITDLVVNAVKSDEVVAEIGNAVNTTKFRNNLIKEITPLVEQIVESKIKK